MFLSAEDLQALTGYRQQCRQIDWLNAHGIDWKINGAGKPLVRVDAINPSGKLVPLEPEKIAAPKLDEAAVYLPMDEIRRRRVPYRIGGGPDGSGVYFLFYRWALTYIGLSVCVGARLRSHCMNRVDRRTRVIPFNKYSVIDVPELWFKQVEGYYIRRERPPFNVLGVPQR